METGDIVRKLHEMKYEFLSKAFIPEEEVVFYMPRYFKRLLQKDIEEMVSRRIKFPFSHEDGRELDTIHGIPIRDGYENKVVICHKTDAPLSNIKVSFDIP